MVAKEQKLDEEREVFTCVHCQGTGNSIEKVLLKKEHVEKEEFPTWVKVKGNNQLRAVLHQRQDGKNNLINGGS